MKTFSSKYLNRMDILKTAIVGFEFEFYSEKSYYKLLEYLNRELSPIKTAGYRVYHSSGEVDENHFKIEPDTSLGSSGLELITGPLSYINAKIILLKILKMIQEFGSTDDKCSIHINISFDKEQTQNTLDFLNPLKIILKVDEDFIYSFFPNRKNNFYAKSVKRMIPFKDYDFSEIGSNLLINCLELPETRYYGINIKNMSSGRLEFRYIGGKDYHKKTDEILQLMDYFIVLTHECINTKLDDEDMFKLREYMSNNINNFKKFAKLDSFIAEFPSVKLQVDTSNDYQTINSFYGKFYNDLHDIISNIYNLSDCLINYDTDTHKLEIVQANFKTIFDVKNVNIIECTIDGGSFTKCDLVDSEHRNGHVDGCKINSTDLYRCKVENSTIDHGCKLIDCYVYNCNMNGKMVGGVFRSGKIGEFAEMENVKILNEVDNYFGVKQVDIIKAEPGSKKDIPSLPNKKQIIK